SGFLAIAIAVSPILRDDGGKPSHAARAAGTASRAALSSGGSTPASGPSSTVHMPLALARSTRRCPAGRIRPSAVSRATRALLVAAQVDAGERGAYHCIDRSSSSRAACPSIQPTQSASRTASPYARRGGPVAAFHDAYPTPSDTAPFSSSHARHCSTVSRCRRGAPSILLVVTVPPEGRIRSARCAPG